MGQSHPIITELKRMVKEKLFSCSFKKQVEKDRTVVYVPSLCDPSYLLCSEMLSKLVCFYVIAGHAHRLGS